MEIILLINLTRLSSIQYWSLLSVLSTIYINPVFTVYLINVSLGGLGKDALALIKCCLVAKS